MIPKAAVEAAEIVLIAHRRRDISSCQCGWAKLGRSHPLHQAQLALEAAAPHMLAAAWDDAIEAHKAWTRDDENMDPLANPYRPTP